MIAHIHCIIITAMLLQTPLGVYYNCSCNSHSCILPGVYSTTLKAETSVTANLLLTTTSPSSSCTSIPSSSPPSSQPQSVLGYSTALGVVSVLLIISLVGHLTTVVVCVLVRKTRHPSADKRQ